MPKREKRGTLPLSLHFAVGFFGTAFVSLVSASTQLLLYRLKPDASLANSIHCMCCGISQCNFFPLFDNVCVSTISRAHDKVERGGKVDQFRRQSRTWQLKSFPAFLPSLLSANLTAIGALVMRYVKMCRTCYPILLRLITPSTAAAPYSPPMSIARVKICCKSENEEKVSLRCAAML